MVVEVEVEVKIEIKKTNQKTKKVNKSNIRWLVIQKMMKFLNKEGQEKVIINHWRMMIMQIRTENEKNVDF